MNAVLYCSFDLFFIYFSTVLNFLNHIYTCSFFLTCNFPGGRMFMYFSVFQKLGAVSIYSRTSYSRSLSCIIGKQHLPWYIAGDHRLLRYWAIYWKETVRWNSGVWEELLSIPNIHLEILSEMEILKFIMRCFSKVF